MGHKHKGLEDLLNETLRQHRDARRHVAKCFGKMAKAAEDANLKAELQRRHDEGDAEHEAIDGLFAVLDRKPHDEACEVTEAQVSAVKRLIDDRQEGPVLDAGLAAAAAAMQALASVRLASTRNWAARLGLTDAGAALARLQDDATASGDRFLALAGQVEAGAATAAQAGDAMTLKQAALIGLR